MLRSVQTEKAHREPAPWERDNEEEHRRRAQLAEQARNQRGEQRHKRYYHS